MSKVTPIPEFTFTNVRNRHRVYAEVIIVVARVVNKLVHAHNHLFDEVEALKGDK